MVMVMMTGDLDDVMTMTLGLLMIVHDDDYYDDDVDEGDVDNEDGG